MSLVDRLRRLVGVKDREPVILDLLDPVPPHALTQDTRITIHPARMSLKPKEGKVPEIVTLERIPTPAGTPVQEATPFIGAGSTAEMRAMEEASRNLAKNAEIIEMLQQTYAKFERRKLPVPDHIKRALAWRRILMQNMGAM